MASAGTKATFVQRHPTLGKFNHSQKSLIIANRPFKNIEDRKAQADKIIQSYPDKIPVICEPAQGSELTLDRTK